VHDAGRELADGGQLLALHDLSLDPAGLGDVLADGDDMTDLVPLQPHGDLAQPEGAELAAEGDVELVLHDLTGVEHPVELGLQLLRRLAGEYFEHPTADDFVPPEARSADLALAVPDLDAVVAIDHVEADRQAVDDQTDEPALLSDLTGLGRDFDRQVRRE
jgi:hypothetical protein